MEEYDHSKLNDFKRIHLVDGAYRFKAEYANLGHKGLDVWIDFPMFYDEKIIKIVLSRIHGDCLWLDGPYQISKEALRDMTSLCSFETMPTLKSTRNDEEIFFTSIVSSKRAFLIDTIVDLVVWYATMGLSYKVYFKNHEGSTSSTIVFVSYKMVKENFDYDLCELLRWQLLYNLWFTKTELYHFWCDSLIVCLVIYFLNALLRLNNIAWRRDVLISAQIRGYLNNLDNCDVSCHKIFQIFEKSWLWGIKFLRRLLNGTKMTLLS